MNYKDDASPSRNWKTVAQYIPTLSNDDTYHSYRTGVEEDIKPYEISDWTNTHVPKSTASLIEELLVARRLMLHDPERFCEDAATNTDPLFWGFSITNWIRACVAVRSAIARRKKKTYNYAECPDKNKWTVKPCPIVPNTSNSTSSTSATPAISSPAMINMVNLTNNAASPPVLPNQDLVHNMLNGIDDDIHTKSFLDFQKASPEEQNLHRLHVMQAISYTLQDLLHAKKENEYIQSLPVLGQEHMSRLIAFFHSRQQQVCPPFPRMNIYPPGNIHMNCIVVIMRFLNSII